MSWDDRLLPAHQLDSGKFSNPYGLKAVPAWIRVPVVRRSSIQEIMQMEEIPSAPESFQNANYVNPENKRHCIMMAGGTKPEGFNRQKKIVLIGEKHQSLSLTSFRLSIQPIHLQCQEMTGPPHFSPQPSVSIMPISTPNKWLARMALFPKLACQAPQMPQYLLWSTWL